MCEASIRLLAAASCIGLATLLLNGCEISKVFEPSTQTKIEYGRMWYNTTVSGTDGLYRDIKCNGGRCGSHGTKKLDFGRLRRLPRGMSNTNVAVQFHFRYTLGLCKKRYEGDDVELTLIALDPTRNGSEEVILKKHIDVRTDDYPHESRCWNGPRRYSPVVALTEIVSYPMPFGRDGIKFVLNIKMGNRNIHLRTASFALGLLPGATSAPTSVFEIPGESRTAKLMRKRFSFSTYSEEQVLSVHSDGSVSDIQALIVNSDGSVLGMSSKLKTTKLMLKSFGTASEKQVLNVRSDGSARVRSRSRTAADKSSDVQALSVHSDDSVLGTSSKFKRIDKTDYHNDDSDADEVDFDPEAKICNGIEMFLSEFMASCARNSSEMARSQADVMQSCSEAWQGKGSDHCKNCPDVDDMSG